MRTTFFTSAALYAAGCAALVAFADPASGSAAQKAKAGKITKAGNPPLGPRAWDPFPAYHPGGGAGWGAHGGGGGGLASVLGLAGSLPMSFGSYSGLNPLGGAGAPVLGRPTDSWSPLGSEWLPFGPREPDALGWREELMRRIHPDFEVFEMLRRATAPSVSRVPRASASHLLQLEEDLAPLRPLAGISGFGPDPIGGLGAWSALNRRVVPSPSGQHAAELLRMLSFGEVPEF